MLKRVILAVFLGVLTFLLSGGLPVSADALADSYDQLARQFPAYVAQLQANGATEDQLRAFVNDLDAALQGQTLTEENFNSALMSAAIPLVTQEKHQAVVEALQKAFPDALQGRVPEGLQPLYSVLKEKLLAAPPAETPPGSGGSSGGSGGGSGGTGGGSGGSDAVALSEVSKEINAATGGTLSFAGVTVEVPGGALPVSATLSVKKLTADEAARVLPSTLRLKLASAVYEINTTGSRNFQKEITIRLNFDPAKIASGEQPTAYLFDGESWVKIGGTAEGNVVVVKIAHLTGFAVFSTPAEAPAAPPVKTFADIANHWARQDIETMLARGLVAGVSPDEFAPDRTVTRAEFATLLVRAVGIPVSPALRSSFADVSAGAWYAAVVAAAAKNGLVSGYSATSFGPEDEITREQMAAMIDRAFAYAGKSITLSETETGEQLARFTDAPAVSAWARESVARSLARGIVKGRTPTAIVPQGTATRAEAAVMVLRMYERLH